MEEKDPNAERFKEVLRDAGLPEFPDADKVYEELKAKERQSVQHSWKQQGPELVCTSCPSNHAQWVGADKRLTGFNQRGEPQFEQITM